MKVKYTKPENGIAKGIFDAVVFVAGFVILMNEAGYALALGATLLIIGGNFNIGRIDISSTKDENVKL